MIRDFLKWITPGLATVLGGTTLCLAMTSNDIADDLSARSAALVGQGGFDWAELSLDMRDLTVSGTTTDQAMVDTLVRRLANMAGIRSVTTAVTLAPMAAPYRLEASIDGATINLSGGVPDASTRQHLLSLAGVSDADLHLRSGMPDRKSWTAGADFIVSQLKYLDQGTVAMTDLTIDLAGRARSERDFRDLLIVMRAGAPAGVTLGTVEITPPLVSPYQWSATSNGERIEVTGFVPDETLAERYHTADVAGLPVATGLALGSGQPPGFAELSQSLIEQLSRLEYGAASIVDGTSTLTGAPPTAEIAQAIMNELGGAGSIVVLDPPRIEDYWVSATRQPGGAVIFDGYAPDQATRDALAERQGADVTWLKLGRGAPERYQSALDFGLAALTQMSEGRFALRDNVVTLTGIAASTTDYQALLSTMAQSAPQGLVLARAEILAPPAAQYDWRAVKEPTGKIVMSGMVPSADAERALVASTGQTVAGSLTYASGEPNNFVGSAQVGIDLLQWLSQGEVRYDGSGWLVTGTARSAIDKGAIDADFVTRQLASAGWSMAVAAPALAVPEASPYLWSASRTAGGVSLDGNIPTESLQSFLVVHAGDGVVDTTALASGAPDDFVAGATAALDAVLALDEGTARFDGTTWSVAGTASSIAARDAVLAMLAAATDTTAWQIDIAAPEPTPVATAPYVWSAVKAGDGVITLSGLVPAAALQRFVAVRAGDGAIDDTTIDPAAPAGFAEDILAAMDVLATLAEGTARFDGTLWAIDGVAREAGNRAAVDAILETAATPDTAWQVDLRDPPVAQAPVAEQPAEPEPVAEQPVAEAEPVAPAPIDPATETVAIAPATPAQPAKVDIAVCRGPIAEFSARNAILFQSGAAIITAESEPALDELAVDLDACPDAVVHIEGHTDADGDEQLNLALSVARAEAVVEALVERGVTPARLYAVGYGESKPVADNETSAGKRLNRRIVVTVTDEHF